MKIKVKDLQWGDILTPTRRRVTREPSAGARTPTGKVDLCLDDHPVQYWKETQVHIEERKRLWQ